MIPQKNPSRPLGRCPKPRGQFRAGRQILLWALCCFAALEATLGGKWLELLSEIAPGLKRAAIMFNPDINPVTVLYALI